MIASPDERPPAAAAWCGRVKFSCGSADVWGMGQASTRRAADRRHRDGRGRGGGSYREAVALDQRRRIKALLANLGLLGLFEKMPSAIRDQFLQCCLPDPQLVFDASFPSAEAFGGAYAAVRQTARDGFAAAVVELDDFDLAVKDYWAIVLPMTAMVRTSLATFDSPLSKEPTPPTSVRAFLEEAVPVFGELRSSEVQHGTYNALHATVVAPLVARSRLDTRLMHAKLDHVKTPRGARLVMTLYSEQSPVKQIRLHHGGGRGSDSAPRPMHRVGTANVWNGIQWATWTRDRIAGGEAAKEWADRVGIGDDAWPVYVQSHALKQLRARLDVYAHADWAEHWMYESLQNPTIAAWLSGEQMLVSYDVMGKRLGYLVVTARDGIVAVRTFLFLTMAQTPEGRLIEQRLRLSRSEIEYLRLHELSRFTRTDLKDDPHLRDLLSACGCGHLFDLAEDEDAMLPTAREVKPFAAELKHYVGLAA